MPVNPLVWRRRGTITELMDSICSSIALSYGVTLSTSLRNENLTFLAHIDVSSISYTLILLHTTMFKQMPGKH